MTEGNNVKIWCEGIQEPFTFKGEVGNIDDVIQFLEDLCTENAIELETKERKFVFQKSKIVCIEILKEV